MSYKGVGISLASRPRSLALNKPSSILRRPKLRRAFTANAGKDVYNAVEGCGITSCETKTESMNKFTSQQSEVSGVICVMSPELKACTLKGEGMAYYSTDLVDPTLMDGNTSSGLANCVSEKESNNSSGISNTSSGILSSKIPDVVYKILSSQLKNMEYNHDTCGEKCRIISQTIENSVKSLCKVQYKIAALVFIGAVRDQGIDISCQCVWNPITDSFAMATYKNESLFASGIVFATVYDD